MQVLGQKLFAGFTC